MKVFISWSGDKSRRIAEEIRKWLPSVIQAIKPYFSPDDVAKGTRWAGEIATELQTSKIGLLILTAENTEAPWLLFEAGALSKSLDTSRVCSLLFDLEPTDVKGPLVQFQNAKFDLAEMKRVIKMINSELGDAALAPDVLDNVFSKWWPELEEKVKRIQNDTKIPTSGVRSDRDLLEEVLALTRRNSGRRFPNRRISRFAIRDLKDCFSTLEASELIQQNEELRNIVARLVFPIEHIERVEGIRVKKDPSGEFIFDENEAED